MAALAEAVRPGIFPAGLFWIARPGTVLLPTVTKFLQLAAAAGVAARLVEVENFDELAGELDRQVTMPAVLAEHVRAARPAARAQPVALPTVEAAPFPVLRCSALPLLAVPTFARRLVLSQASTTPDVRALLREARVRGAIACQGREVAAFGRDAELIAALAPLGAKAEGELSLDPLADSWALGLLYNALAWALARGRPLRPILRRRGHSVVVVVPDSARTDELAVRDRERLSVLSQAYGAALTGTVAGLGMPFAEAARLRLERWLDRWWCVFEPFTWIELPHPEQPADDGDRAADDARRSGGRGATTAHGQRSSTGGRACSPRTARRRYARSG